MTELEVRPATAGCVDCGRATDNAVNGRLQCTRCNLAMQRAARRIVNASRPITEEDKRDMAEDWGIFRQA